MAYTMSKADAYLLKLSMGTDMRMSLYRKIVSFLEEGIPLNEILEQLHVQYSKGKRGKDSRARLIGEWLAAMGSGKRFSEILSDWVPAGESMLIRAGERSGDLVSAFSNAIQTTEAIRRMKSTLIGKLSYPFVLLLMMLALIYLFSTQAVPQLVSVKDPSTWPDPAKRLYEMSMFVKDDWWQVFAAIGVFAVFASFSMPRMNGGLRKILDVIPPWSIYKTFQSSVFMISVASMMKSGTPIVNSISELRDMSSPYVGNHLTNMLNKLDAGRPIGKSLNGGFLDKETGVDVEIYGELSNLQKSMERIGRDSIENSIANISAASVLLNNLVLVGVTVYIGWVYYAFFLLTQSIGVDAGNQF